MRYLGNKESLIFEIIDMLKKHNLYQSDEITFFDAFCGTGSVSDAVKDRFNLILNDNLKFSSLFSAGRIYKGTVDFKNLGFNPIDYLNNSKSVVVGFCSKNFAPKLSKRMYFTDFNAGRIDYFKATIDEWYETKKIDLKEYYFLLASLLESISKVANIAGVYGAYLKKWDPRAVKDIKFIEVEGRSAQSKNVTVYSNNLNEIMENVECDVLYLDPPYTKNKYSVQYHLLESLILQDEKPLHGITGTRKFDYVSDDWSKPYKVEVAFDECIFKTKTKAILMSYSSDGLMSKEFIINVLKRYCYEDSVECIEIDYKKYRNFKTKSTDKHFEYLFYGVKKPIEEILYCCPLNYMGGKSQIIGEIRKYFLKKHKFIDLMAGGFNAGINTQGFNKIIYNDYNHIVKDLIFTFKESNTSELLKFIDKTIKEFNLNKHDKDNYIQFRTKYNSIYRYQKNWTWYLYVLILYGFQQQIRFNSKYEFNNPVGESGYSENIKEKIVSFSRAIKNLNVQFYSLDFEEIGKYIDEDTVVYIDPPYLITLGSYNDGKRGFKGWNENEEQRLLNFLSKISQKHPQIVLSNVLNYNNKENSILKKWVEDNGAKIYTIKFRNRLEALIIL